MSEENEKKPGWWREWLSAPIGDPVPMPPILERLNWRNVGTAMFFLFIGSLFFHSMYHDWYMRRAADHNTYVLCSVASKDKLAKDICKVLKVKLEDK